MNTVSTLDWNSNMSIQNYLPNRTYLAVALVFCSERRNSKMNGDGDGDVAFFDWLINKSVCIEMQLITSNLFF